MSQCLSLNFTALELKTEPTLASERGGRKGMRGGGRGELEDKEYHQGLHFAAGLYE